MVQSEGPTCGSCGGWLTAEARLCPECGAPAWRFCPKYGAPRTSQARFRPERRGGIGVGSSAVRTAPPAAPAAELLAMESKTEPHKLRVERVYSIGESCE